MIHDIKVYIDINPEEVQKEIDDCLERLKYLTTLLREKIYENNNPAI